MLEFWNGTFVGQYNRPWRSSTWTWWNNEHSLFTSSVCLMWFATSERMHTSEATGRNPRRGINWASQFRSEAATWWQHKFLNDVHQLVVESATFCSSRQTDRHLGRISSKLISEPAIVNFQNCLNYWHHFAMVLENRGAESLATPQKHWKNCRFAKVLTETVAEVTFGVHDFASSASRSRQVLYLCVVPMSCRCRADVVPMSSDVFHFLPSHDESERNEAQCPGAKGLKGLKGLVCRRTTMCWKQPRWETLERDCLGLEQMKDGDLGRRLEIFVIWDVWNNLAWKRVIIRSE